VFDIHQSIIDEDSGEIDPEALESYIGGLAEEFANSPEAAPVREEYGLGWAGSLMQYAADYLGVTPPEMAVRDFREVVFEIIPRKVSTEPASAGAIVAELRAFWQFLQRAYQLPNAAGILSALQGDAAARLERELADPANYGMAKSFFMMGQQLGFDMTTQEGLDAFMHHYNSRLAGGMGPGSPGGLPGPPPLGFAGGLGDLPEDDYSLPPEQTPKQRAERRKKHKAQRQARKRNRGKK
jgi:hypothetical protein